MKIIDFNNDLTFVLFFPRLFVTLATPNILGTQKSSNTFGFSFVF